VRSKHLEIPDVTAREHNQGINGQLNEYVKAREAGLQPQTWFTRDVKAAWKATDAMGVPFRADA